MRHFYTLRCPVPFWLIQCTPYQNRFIIAKVIAKSLGARFLWPTVYNSESPSLDEIYQNIMHFRDMGCVRILRPLCGYATDYLAPFHRYCRFRAEIHFPIPTIPTRFHCNLRMVILE